MPLWLPFSLALSISPLLSIAISCFLSLLSLFKYPFKAIRQKGGERTHFRRVKKIVCRLNFFLGWFEYTFRAPRNFIFVPFFLGMLIVRIADLSLDRLFWPLFFLGLVFTTSHQSLTASIRLGEFLRTYPNLHPKIFFHAHYHLLGPFPHTLPTPKEDSMIYPENASFKKQTRPRKTLTPLIIALWDTAHLAHITLRIFKYVGPAYIREMVDLIGSMWGKRILDLMQAHLEVRGREKLNNLDGKRIIIMNHKSQLDFALGFFALSNIRLASGRNMRLRFITAKDHFVDNPIVYELMGVGKAIEAVDMVFIDRKKKGEAFLNLLAAAKTLVEKEIDLVIYPQGTRAEGNVDRSNKRRDAGYYTTVSPKDITSDLGHLRKGCAYLVVDTLMAMAQKQKGPLHLVFVGLTGTATAFSKQSIKIQTETDILFNIGDVVTLSPEWASDLSKPSGTDAQNPQEQKYLDLVDELHKTIDEKLVSSLDIHENLRHRFLLDLQGHFRFTSEKIEGVENNLIRFSNQSSIVYQILDRLYACPPPEWNSYLSELAHLLMDQSPVGRFATLRTQVTLRMLKHLKKKIHGKKITLARNHPLG